MLLHPVIGISVCAVTAAVLALLLLVRSQTARGGPSYLRLVGWLVAGVAVTLPYVLSVAPGRGSSAMASFTFLPFFAVGLLSDILPALVLTLWFFHHAADHTDTPEHFGARPVSALTLSGSGMLWVWFIFTLLVALVVDLPVNNETKFSFFLWLPLCALSTGCFERMWGWRSRRFAALALLASSTLPLCALYYHHAVRDHSVFEVTDDERSVYGWIRTHTPRNAVFVEGDDIVRVPVLADRDNYWGTDAYARNWGYASDEMARRRSVRDHLFSRNGPGESDFTPLRALGRPVFVISRAGEDGGLNVNIRFHESAHLRGRFSTATMTVWEVVWD
jgi:hypothetical protein